jgi:hypothetical protein
MVHRGSVLDTDASGTLPFGADGVSEVPGLPEELRFALNDGARDGKVQEVGFGVGRGGRARTCQCGLA